MTRKMAVLGFPIEHSLSPIIHSKAMDILGISGSYERFSVNEDELAHFLDSHENGEWRGFSLTMPLKEEGFRLSEPCDEGCKLTQVVNTLVKSPNGWHSYNTDVSGFRFLLEDKEFKSVSILGTGGTARAALFAVKREVDEIEIYRRNAKNDALCSNIFPNVVFREWHELSDAFNNQLLVNATAASANDEIRSYGRQVPIAIDAVYAPWPPPLLAFQEKTTYFSGKDLLVAQALEQISLFHNLTFDKDEMFKSLRSLI